MKRRLRRGGCLAWRQTAFTVEVDVPTCRAIARADMPVGSSSRICCFFAALIGRQTVLRIARAVVVSLASVIDATLAVLGSGATSPAMRRSRKASRGSQLFELMLPRCTNKLLPEPTPVENVWDVVPDDEQRSPTRVGVVRVVGLVGVLPLVIASFIPQRLDNQLLAIFFSSYYA